MRMIRYECAFKLWLFCLSGHQQQRKHEDKEDPRLRRWTEYLKMAAVQFSFAYRLCW